MSDLVTYLNQNQGFALVLVTTALVAITAFYAVYTRQLATAANRPNVQAKFDILGGNHIQLKIMNFGPSPALDVEVNISFERVAAPIVWKWPIIAPSQEYGLFIRDTETSEVMSLTQLQEVGSMLFEAKYQQPGALRSIKTKHKIGLPEAIESSIASNIAVPGKDATDILKDIHERLRGIERSLGEIARKNERQR